MTDDMGFLVISEGGDGLGLAIRLQEEGHKTSMWFKDPIAEQRGEGLIERGTIPEYGPTLVADCTGSGALLDSYKSMGGRVYGGSQLQDKLEGDRRFTSEIFREAGIQEPHSEEFNNWEEAKKFVELYEGEKLVFKPGGKQSGNLPSYVAYDNPDMFYYLDHAKTIMGEHEPEFTLQEFIKGTCISSEVWVAKGKMLVPTNHTLERKQLMCGDLGPSGGCTGNVVWVCSEGDCPLCAQLRKLEGFLEENEYNGCLDINSVVSTEGEIYALEFTPRFGYDAFPTLLLGLFDSDFGGFINDSIRGDRTDVPLKDGFAAGVRVSVPPWPSEDFTSKGDARIGGLRESDFDRFYPYEVSISENQIRTSQGWGIIGVSIGFSEDGIEEAFEEAYKLCHRIKLTDKQFRVDLGEVFQSDLTKLRRSLGVTV